MTETELIEKYRKSTNRLILLDYDGTLIEFDSFPKKAPPPQKVTSALLNLKIIKGHKKIAPVTSKPGQFPN